MRKHLPRLVVTALPLLLALLHAAGVLRLPFIDSLDRFIYDVRLRATMPRTMDPRIVIVDIDDRSLQRLGQWPWSRDKLAVLTDELFARQGVAALGYDLLFVERDASAPLERLRRLAMGPLRSHPEFGTALAQLIPESEPDEELARSMRGRNVAVGFYLSRTDPPRVAGHLLEPILPPHAIATPHLAARTWNGYGGTIREISEAAAGAGFVNVVLDAGGDNADGAVRSVPLLALYRPESHASDDQIAGAQPGFRMLLAVSVFRLAWGRPTPIEPVVERLGATPVLEGLDLGPADVAGDNDIRRRIPLSPTGDMLVPFRGPGGSRGESFRYVSAVDLIEGRIEPGALTGKIVLVGSTAPGLQDLRPTPVDAAFPGVEIHANVISALLDGRFLSRPSYAPGVEFAVNVIVGLILALALGALSVWGAGFVSLATFGAAAALNFGLYSAFGLVFPLASTLLMILLVLALDIGWGYFVEARAGRGLAELFGTYVPPQLVAEMQADPRRYTMRAQSKEMTVMFCDMRGFTRLSETLDPQELQSFLNRVFSRLTQVISSHRGTVDKYMGDCVMAFWGAPLDAPDHATLAVAAALDMAAAVLELNDAQRKMGQPEFSVGIGINTGVMAVGDMGSAVRRSYTVIGDAVNLAARLEGLCVTYGVDIVVSGATRAAVPGVAWRELDLVRVKGKAEIVQIYTPVGWNAQITTAQGRELQSWARLLYLYRIQRPSDALTLLESSGACGANKVLYRLYAERLASMASLPVVPDWDGATLHDNK